jgi:hypothetical protein
VGGVADAAVTSLGGIGAAKLNMARSAASEHKMKAKKTRGCKAPDSEASFRSTLISPYSPPAAFPFCPVNRRLCTLLWEKNPCVERAFQPLTRLLSVAVFLRQKRISLRERSFSQ